MMETLIDNIEKDLDAGEISEMEQIAEEEVAGNPEVKPDVVGYIDTIEAGFASGWALDVNTNADDTYVSLEVGGKLYGRALANQYRQDIEEAGISDGNNGFSIPLDEFLKEKIGQQVSLKVNNKKLTESTVKFDAPDGQFWCGVEKIENCHLVGSIVSEKFSGIKTITIKDAGKTVAVFDLPLETGSNNILLPLPFSLFDDDYHLLTIGVKDYPFALCPLDRKQKADRDYDTLAVS